MTGKVKISFMIVVWSIVAIQMYVNYRQEASRALTAFSVVKDESLTETIKGYGYFETMKLGTVSRKKMLEKLAKDLGITDGYTFTSGAGDGYKKLILTKRGRHATTILQIVSLSDELDESGVPEQYIAVDITTKKKYNSAVELYHRVKKLYKDMGLNGRVSLEVEAEQKGNVIADKGEETFDELLSGLNAKKVDAITDNGIYTVYGYTRNERDHLMLNGRKVNVQIVMSYDEEKDKTYFKIGMPIVNTSY